MAVDIAASTLNVGNALASVRIDQMILSLAKGIAWGQYELDKVGVDITKMMGVPGVVSIGGESLSMLEAGFVPSFYHFVDTILELKMEVHVREEQSSSLTAKESVQRATEVETGGEVSAKAEFSAGAGGFFSASAEVAAKAHWNTKSTSAYSRSVDASHAQKFSQDLSATSLMRTKIVPIPPPELLVERIKILLDRLRTQAEAENEAQVLLRLDGTHAAALDAWPALDAPEDARAAATALIAAFNEEGAGKGPGGANLALAFSDVTVNRTEAGVKWSLTNALASSPDQAVAYLLVKDAEKNEIRVYSGAPDSKPKSFDEILMGKIEDKLLERVTK